MTAAAMSGGDMTDEILAEFMKLDEPSQRAVLDLVKRFANGNCPSGEDALAWCLKRAEHYRKGMGAQP